MRTLTVTIFILSGLGFLGAASGASAETAVPPFVPGDLVIGYKSTADADAALADMKSATNKVRVRGAPAEGIQAKKVLDTTVSIHIDLPHSISAAVRGNPVSELAVLKEIAAGIKASDNRVAYAHPNWIMTVQPPPVPDVDRKASMLPLRSVGPLNNLAQQPSPGTRNFVISQDGPTQGANDPNDTYYTLQWDYLPPPRGMNAINAWKTTKGSKDIVVAIIDTGIVPNQEDIAASGHVLPGYNFVSKRLSGCPDERDSGPGATDPGDDRTLCRSGEARPGSALDPSWHGTHVAGTIGAVATNDNLGIAGIAWNVTILPIRVLGAHGGTTSDIVTAMAWAVGYHVPGVPDNDHPADIINMSLGGPIAADDGTFLTCNANTEPDYMQAIDLVRKAGAVLVVAAGNGEPVNAQGKYCKAGSPGCKDGPVDLKYDAPGGCPGVISVTSSDMHGVLAPYSNFGAATIMAPGGNALEGAVIRINANGKKELVLGSIVQADGKVWSANKEYGGILSTVKDSYVWLQGTSMAAPHVAGALALMLAARPQLRHHPDLIEQALRAAAVRPVAGACVQGPCGTGQLDAVKLVMGSQSSGTSTQVGGSGQHR